MRLRFTQFLIRYSGILGRAIVGSGGGRAQGQPPLGQAIGTLRNDQSAFKLWVAYRNSRSRPTEITVEELVEAEEIIIDLCRFTSSRMIPYNFDENLERPANSNTNRLVASTTLEKYIGKIIKYFRVVDPNHPDWRDLDPNDQKAVPEFWSNLRPNFKKEIQLFHLLYRGDGVIGLEDIRPLYDFLGLDDEGGKYPHRVCDLKHIFIHLIKTADGGGNRNNLQRLAIIHAIAEAIGRGGEAKFQTFRDWLFDPLWNVTNTPWKEKKTIQGYAMARVADEHWYNDWYCTMAMFALCENGLYRTPSQKNGGMEHVVFPLLHGRKDEGATTLVTETIRSALPEDVKKYYSAKSLRQGGINRTTQHPDMNYFFLSALTGHAGDNNSSQYYIDSTDVGRCVPALNALHGKRDLKTPIAIPTLDALGPADKATARKFMDEVFNCNLERFMEGGDLHIVKETFLASLLMHHRELKADCGALNRVSDTLLDKARGCGVSCATITTLHEQNASLRRELNEMSMTVARRTQQMASTPEGGISNKRQRVSTDLDGTSLDLDGDTATGTSDILTTHAAALPDTTAVTTTTTTTTATIPTPAPAAASPPSITAAPAPAPAPPAPAPPPAQPLRHGFTAEQASKKKKSMRNNDLRDYLEEWAKRGAFRMNPSKLAKGTIPADYQGEKSLAYFCLELVDYVAERNEDVRGHVETVLSAKTDMSPEAKLALKDAVDAVVTECHHQLNLLVPSTRATETKISGMGKWIGDYKNRIKDAKNLSRGFNKGDVQLIPLDQLEQLEFEKTQRDMGT